MKVISADSHVLEPPDLYQERIPARYRSRIPRYEVADDGTSYWIVDGRKPWRQDIAMDKVTEEDNKREFRLEENGGRDVERRLADQELDGISAEVVYPTSGLVLYNSPDPGYQLAVARAYNDWAIEVFGSHTSRFTPVAVIPVKDIPAAVLEVQRAAQMGYRAVKIPLIVKEQPYNLPDYEPLWSAIEELGLVLNLHAFSTTEDTFPEDLGEAEGMGGGLSFWVFSLMEGQTPVNLLISSGVLQRHPNLRFVVVECGAGWLAWLLYAMDEMLEKKHIWINPQLDMMPSEFFKRQGHVTFGDDPVALTTLGYIGSQSLLWGSDYPHDEGTFPYSQEVIERTFKGIPEADKRRIICDNTANLYGFN